MNASLEQRFIILCVKKPTTGVYDLIDTDERVVWEDLRKEIDRNLFDARLKELPTILCDHVWQFLEEGSEDVVKWIKERCQHYRIPFSISRTHERPDIIWEYADAQIAA